MSARPSLKSLPPLFRRLVRAAEEECPDGHAEALAAFIALALQKVPARGIFDPGTRDENEFYAAVQTIAKAHLELDDALTAFRRAMKAANLAFEPSNDIESAAHRVQNESDTAYFYAGLAFGLVFAGAYAPGS